MDESTPKPPLPLTPEARRHTEEPIAGPTMVDHEGREWVLPYCRRGKLLAEWRCEIADRAWTGGRFDPDMMRSIVMILLQYGYELDAGEAATIAIRTPAIAVMDAVLDALLLPSDDDATTPRNYDQWLQGGLIAAGLSGAKISDEMLPFVVSHLIKTGRMAAPVDFLSAAIGARSRAQAIAMLTAED
jgi:hypothetical protein